MALVQLLEQEALKRGLLGESTELTLELAFALVRDLRYQRASSRHPEAIITEWRGTCSGKHYLLQKLLAELGYQTKLMICTHQFTMKNSSHFPQILRDLLRENPIPDVHNFMRLKTEKGWMDIDATWPISAQKLGLTVNPKLELGQDMRIACEAIQIWEVPSNIEAQRFKEELIQKHCQFQIEERERFIQALSDWLNSEFTEL
jgi:hypothetical protein